MPILERDLPYEEMRKLERDGHTCFCGGKLSTAWSARDNCYILRCGINIEHNTITRHDKEWEELKTMVTKERNLDSNALVAMPEARMLQRVEMAKFPQELTITDKKLLAKVAITYGFDPLMGEVSIYQGKPFVSIDGRYRKAQETGNLAGVDTRPATKDEREAWEIPAGDYFFRAAVHVKDCAMPFVGWGRVSSKECTGGKGFRPVETNPQRMAEKRAEAQALRKAFHIPLPSIEDIGSPEESEPVTVKVEAETPKEAPTNGNGKGMALKRDPESIKNIGDLYNALREDYPECIKTDKDILARLNLRSGMEIGDLQEAYLKVVESIQNGTR